MIKDHPIKEYAEEIEPKDRKCLFCRASAPDRIKTEDMVYSGKNYINQGWYSNAGLKNGIIARFYLCPKHKKFAAEAWEWIREGFSYAK